MFGRLKSFSPNWSLTAIILFYIYLAVHALSGEQGLMRWVQYEEDIDRKRAVLDVLLERRARLEMRAKDLRPIGLDIDILDARAREKLFVSHPNDYVIFLDPTP